MDDEMVDWKAQMMVEMKAGWKVESKEAALVGSKVVGSAMYLADMKVHQTVVQMEKMMEQMTEEKLVRMKAYLMAG